MNQIPLLFLGDSPSSNTGLARIGRDLAHIASRLEEFQVGYLGRGMLPTRRLPYMQYTFDESHQWGETYLQSVWQDFAGDKPGIVMTVWDPSRLLWFSHPVGMPNEAWLRNAPFKRWGYFAVDATGPNNKLTVMNAATLQGYDRVLAYGMFGAEVIGNTLQRDVEWIPHGVNMDTFQPRDGKAVRVGMGISPDTTVIGCVMTNQVRKNWGLAFETAAILRQRIPKLKVWFKVDSIDRSWDLRALATDFGVDALIDVGEHSDEALSYMYSICDLTFLPSLGEGFGYPIVESLACGVPCIHGNYGGGAELIPKPEWLVAPAAWRYETRYNCRRPVYDVGAWVDTIIRALQNNPGTEFCRSAVSHLDWKNLYTVWDKWFKEGVNGPSNAGV